MEVIGAGFGRTGTQSMKAALEQLGFGPCHHGVEVLAHLDTAQYWIDAADGRPVDWDRVFDGYRATVDWPSARFWRETAAHFPEAKVVLTVRDPDKWYDSMCQTIFGAFENVPDVVPPQVQGFLTMVRRVTIDGHFDGKVPDRETAVRVFNEHVAAVRAEIPADRLLVYSVSEGWGPLCDFLGVPVPRAPFPHANDQEQFNADFAARRAAAARLAASDG